MRMGYLGKVAGWMVLRWPRYRGLALGILAVLAVAVSIWPVKAAIQLAYFKATPTANAVLLEWATLSEYNVAGFELLCKGVQDLDTAYHRIAVVDALGTATQGAMYQFPVTGLVAGEQYCFRLHEVTTNGEPGDQFDLCGYGLGITPTPSGVVAQQAGQESVPLIPVADTSPTPTAVLVGPVGTVVPLPTIPTVTATPTLTVTPAAGITTTPGVEQPRSPLVAGGATAAPVVQPPQSPMATPSATPAQAAMVDSNAAARAVPSASTADSLAVVALAPPVSTPDPLAAAAELLAAAPPPPLPTVVAMPTPAATPTPADTLAPAATLAPEAIALAQVAPTPVYLVVTATPTATPDRSLAAVPLFTPLPTATPTEAYAELTQWLAPTSQNLMLMLLCFTFVGASGLGLMGLITSVIYMRARSRRTPYGDGYSSRALRRRL